MCFFGSMSIVGVEVRGFNVNSWGLGKRLSYRGAIRFGSGWLPFVEGKEDAAPEVVKVAIAKGNALNDLDRVVAAFGEAVGAGAVKGIEDVFFPVLQACT